MALKENTGSRTYLSIREGKIAQKNGEEWTLYNSVEGYIVGISTRDGKYGTDLCIDLQDDKLYQLQFRLKGSETGRQSSYFISFAHSTPNIDPTKKVEFVPSLKTTEDGKKKAALFLIQDGKPIKWGYKRGDGIMPDPEEILNKKGEIVSLDWSEVEVFRVNVVNEFNEKVLSSKTQNTMMVSDPVGDEPTDDTFDTVSDDLPF